MRPIANLYRSSGLRTVWICSEVEYEDYCSAGCDAVYRLGDINLSRLLSIQQIETYCFS